MKIDSEELKEYIRAVIESIEKGIGEDHYMEGGIKFKLQVKNVSKGEGGIKILVADIGGKKEKENVNTIEFTVKRRPKGPDFVIT